MRVDPLVLVMVDAVDVVEDVSACLDFDPVEFQVLEAAVVKGAAGGVFHSLALFDEPDEVFEFLDGVLVEV